MPLPNESYFGRIGIDPPAQKSPSPIGVQSVKGRLLRVVHVRVRLVTRAKNDTRP